MFHKFELGGFVKVGVRLDTELILLTRSLRCFLSQESNTGLSWEQLRESLRRKEDDLSFLYPAFSLRSVWDKSQTYQAVIARKRASGRGGLTCRRA